jgi:cobalt-zinc-cadmium efflux system membrane fusion protein
LRDSIHRTVFPVAGARRWPQSWRRIAIAASLLATAALIAVSWYVRRADLPSKDAEMAADTASATSSAGVIILPAEQQQAAEIHCTTLSLHDIQETRRVPGKIGYNTGKRLEVKLPVAGVLTKVFVQPGQAIQQGDQLAMLTSTEVGLARSEVVAAEAEVELAQKASAWADEITANLHSLATLLDTKPEMEEVEKQFKDLRLGDHRSQVLSAYSKLLMTQKVAASGDAVAASGALSGIVLQERRSNREVAAAQFTSALEQSLFESSQQQVRAKATLEKAERLLSVARQKLKLLLGPYAEIVAGQHDDSSCELIVRAPMNGIVEERPVAEGSHTAAAQLLFALTNTDTLWVSAYLYDRDWSQVRQEGLRELAVQVPAVPEYPITARVLYTAVTTAADSSAVPLVAEFENTGGRFKPGMFAWVSVPVSRARKALTVPESAVTRSENKTFVFVEDKPGTYRRVDVDLGPTSGDMVEVRHGLKPGERIVDHGVFVLKSELLLGETES